VYRDLYPLPEDRKDLALEVKRVFDNEAWMIFLGVDHPENMFTKDTIMKVRRLEKRQCS
jgi:hypothetical protein